VKKTILIIVAVVVILVVAAGLVWFGTWFGNRTLAATTTTKNSWFGGRGNNQFWGSGMMGSGRGFNGGMMGDGRGFNGGMMGDYGNNQVAVTPLSLDEAKKAADSYLATLSNTDLQISEIMIFDNNAYVAVTEKSSGVGAFELLVDPVTKSVFSEPGPNMMWNLKYGGMKHAGMMNGYGASSTNPVTVSADMTVSAKQAIQYAQDFLDANINGAKAATDPMKFYGYYTLDYTVDGKVAGMLSVNGYNGQIFLHTWHGTFIEEKSY